MTGAPGAPGAAALDLAGHRVLVTGAARGIGLGLARTFAEWGATVALADLAEAAAAAAARDLARPGVAVAMDVTDEAAVERGVARAWEAMGGIDLLVNNAGVLSVARVTDMALAEWSRVLTVNATGTFLASRAVARAMQAAGRGGSIVCVSSIAGRRGDPGLAHYSASKFAVIGFAQALAREVAADDILVNALCPGVVETAMIGALARDTGTATAEWLAAQAIRRAQTPRDLAFAAGFLHLSRAVTGQALNVDGGTLFG